MTPSITQADVLAFAVLELRQLLSAHLGNGETDDPPADAVAAIAQVDGLVGENPSRPPVHQKAREAPSFRAGR
jgi:hypothetical protein